MTNYLPPDPSVGEFVHRKNEVLRECLEQIENLNDQELRDLVNDGKQSSDLRVIALLQLVPRRDRDSRAELLCDFLDDPDPDVSAAALSHCPLIDKRSIEKARRMVGSPHGRVKSEAVVALAKWGDQTILSQLLEWFAGDDEQNRNLAIEGLKTLASDEAKLHLEQSYEQGGRDDMDRAVLAIALLRLRDERGVDFLKTVAERAQGPLSVMAATWLYGEYKPDTGLKLMLNLLDNGDLEAKRGMVNQVWNFAHLPHAFTADGIHEARLWVQQKLSTA